MATYTFDKIEYGSNTYVVSDSGALQLTGGQVTGPVTFGDSVSIDEATLGDLVVNGSASFTNNIQANTINGVTVGSSPKFTDTNTEVSTLTLVAGSTAGTSLTSGGKFTLTAGSKTVSFTMPTIPTVPSNIVNTITTTAGAHTAISSQKGNVSFNVPTTAAHVGAATSDHTHGNITNGGDITATAPTIASGDQIIINDHSASKITNGPTFDGSTTTTALTPKGTWESFAKTSSIPTITLNGAGDMVPSWYAPTTAGTSGYVLKSNGSGAPTWTSATLTDENVKSTVVTAATTNYIVGSTTSTTTTGGLSKHASGVLYTTADSGTGGYTQLRLGNTTATNSSGGKEGQIRLYGTTATYYVDLKGGAPSANRTITLPNATGTVALTSDIPTITLNGNGDMIPSWYAPTTAGTSGQYLKSNGSGPPTWAAIPEADATKVQIVRW